MNGFSIIAGNGGDYDPDDGGREGGGGGVTLHDGNPEIRNCTIKGNYSSNGGGGIYNYGAAGSKIVNCYIVENRARHGGGFAGKSASEVEFWNCRFLRNVADDAVSVIQGGGLAFESIGQPKIVNSVISDNRSIDAGGGIHAWASTGFVLTMINCTVSGNVADGVGGGIRHNKTGVINIHNSIIWGNEAAGVGDEISTDDPINVTYSNINRVGGSADVDDAFSVIEYGAGMLGTIASDDPLLQADYSLGIDSPSIDKGSNALLPDDIGDVNEDSQTVGQRLPCDLILNIRVIADDPVDTSCDGPTVDMGAFEGVDCDGNEQPDWAERWHIVSETNYRVTEPAVEGLWWGTYLALDSGILTVSSREGNVFERPAVATFVQTGSEWVRDPTELVAPDPSFGTDFGPLAMSLGRLIVGEPSSGQGGKAHVFVRGTNGWTLEQTFLDSTSSGTQFGRSVDIDMAVGVAIVGSEVSASIWRYNSGSWSEEVPALPVTNPVKFGAAVAIRGNLAAVGDWGAEIPGSPGVPNAGAVYIYEYAGGQWSQTHILSADDAASGAGFGTHLDIDENKRIVVGAEFDDHHDQNTDLNKGAAYIFDCGVSGWTQTQRLEPDWPGGGVYFGRTVAIDSGFIVVGSPGEGSAGDATVYVYRPDADCTVGAVYWILEAKYHFENDPPAPADPAYYALTRNAAVSGHTIVVAAPSEDHGGQVDVGAVHIIDVRTRDMDMTGILDECELGFVAPPEAVVAGTVVKNRFISFTASPPASTEHAIRVRLTSLHDPSPANTAGNSAPDFWAHTGQDRWVGQPTDCGQGGLKPNYKCAALQCTPTYVDWASALDGAELFVYGREIVPDSVYEVEVLSDSCEGSEGTCSVVSSSVAIATARWGDIASPFNDRTASGQPNAIDIAASVDSVKGVQGSLPEASVMLRPELMNPDDPAMGNVNAFDIAYAVDAVKGKAYQFGISTSCN